MLQLMHYFVYVEIQNKKIVIFIYKIRLYLYIRLLRVRRMVPQEILTKMAQFDVFWCIF